MITIDEFISDLEIEHDEQHNSLVYKSDIKIKMIEFAKLHVKAALEAASENAELLDDKECWRNCSCERPCKIINKSSILNVYSLDNIK